MQSRNDPGIEILQVKNQLLTSYVVDLVYLVLLKCQGISNSAATVDRIVEIRTILEKIRPIEQKFSYHLDKLLRTATSVTASGAHPLHFRPAPENLVSKLVEESCSQLESGEESGEDVGGPGVYVPPRVIAMPYKEPTLPKSHVGKKMLIRELRDEITEFPTELETFNEGFKKRKLLKDERIRQKYEEDHMTRLSNRQKSQNLGRNSREELEDIVDFSSLKGLATKRGASGRMRKRRRKT